MAIDTAWRDPDAYGPEGDERLIARARDDPQAFGELYDRYLDPIHRYCLRRLGDRAAAEDVTSQVFLQALAALTRYRPDGNGGTVRSWLFAIAHNAVADQGRHRARRPTTPIDDALTIADPGPGPEDEAIRVQTRRELTDALAHLTDDQRAVITLRLAGLTGPEIARAVGRSHGSVRLSQFRALARLRDLLGSPSGRTGQKERADRDDI